MSERTDIVNGVAYVLPSDEPKALFVKRIGQRHALGLSVRLSSFGIGFDKLRGGFLVGVGPFFLWFVHIEKFESSKVTAA